MKNFNINEALALFFNTGLNGIANLIGPQNAILDRLNRFNTNYRYNEKPITITKKYRWSPGTIDKIKQVYANDVLDWNRRASSVHSVFDRVNQYKKNRIKEEINWVDNQLQHARWSRTIWLDDKNDEGYLQQLVYEWLCKLENLYKASENYDLILTVTAATEHDWYRNGSDSLIEGKFLIKLSFPQRDITITNEAKILGKIPTMPIQLYILIDLPTWISHNMSGTNFGTSFNNDKFAMRAKYKFDSKTIGLDGRSIDWQKIPVHHPFISRRNWRGGGTHAEWGNVCMGTYITDIMNSFFQMNFNNFFFNIYSWLYQYEVIGANPLNNIRLSFLGISKKNFPEEMLSVIGFDAQNCFDRLSKAIPTIDSMNRYDTFHDYPKIVNYCDTLECDFRSKCWNYNFIDNTKDVCEAIVDSVEGSAPVEMQLDNATIMLIHKNMLYFTDIEPIKRHMPMLWLYDKLPVSPEISNEVLFGHRSSKENLIITYLLKHGYIDQYLAYMALVRKIRARPNEDQFGKDNAERYYKVCLSAITNCFYSVLDKLSPKDESESTKDDISNMHDIQMMMQQMSEWSQSIENNR